MGVHGLWELLAPVGRRVSVETLAGKKLAIDASIWMIQFMKAMRDEKGEMIRNAHIVGFFRRICKLLFLRTKPVFVFDGGTPALKRRTVIARRRQRENAQAKVRKTAEKLLLNHLKAMRLKEISEDLKKQRQSNDLKGKKAIVEESNFQQETEKGNDERGMSFNQEELDAMLAASLAAEESEGFTGDASTSGSGVPLDNVFGDEDEDEDEEIILPEMHGKVDPAVLASLPPSMQLDLLVQMRERLMAENRQKYQKVKKAPERFSELQIQSYLKTVAFRREIDGVQKSAAERGIGGVQTSRIASESNREFIFSSSFTGDKQAFTSAGQEITGADQSQPPPVTSSINAVNRVTPTKRDGTTAGPSGSETGKAFHDDVEAYLDERGNLRVSRVRALGIRMTRDLQRNLDLMKEMELEKAGTNPKDGETTTVGNLVDVLGNSSNRILHQKVTNMNNNGLNDEVEKIKEPALIKGTSVEVSFEDTHELQSGNEDDNLFASLVAGDPIMDFSIDNSAYEKYSLHSTSDFEWEEGVTENKVTIISNESDVEWEEGVIEDKTKVISDEGEWEEGCQDTELKSTSCAPQKDNTISSVSKGAQEQAKFQREARSDEGEPEWEEGFQDPLLKFSSYAVENHNTVSKGAEEEETELQEAIRRSLENVADQPEIAGHTVSDNIDWMFALDGKLRPEVHASLEGASQLVEQEQQTNNLESDVLEKKSAAAFVEVNFDESNLASKLLSQDSGRSGSLVGEILSAAETVCEEKMFSRSGKPIMDNFIKDDNGRALEKVVENYKTLVATSYSSNLRPESLLDSIPADAENMFRASLDDHSCETAKISASDSITDADELAKGKIDGDFSMEKEESTIEPSFIDVDENHEVMDSRLEEELLFLDKERDELGNEQRKNERNAESVSTEMFVECQELLQMFGLPYIIAPMEAEAQCAFMELSNLVDGVVTDDSDAFLFGAQSVYKNIFDDRKYVETYLMKDMENELGLAREKLIHMALLLGSDYTEGVSGIGIVNAIEVINAFPEKDGLQEFRSWIESPDPTILGKLDVQPGGNNLKGKGSKEGISCDHNIPHSEDTAERIKQTFMNKHRNVSKNWHIPSSFPSDAVISAYAAPQVDKSTVPFSWGKPDLSVLRKLCWEKFGWGTSKADELLLPVLKEYNKHETQLRLEAFYTFNERFAKIRSKRITKALKGITGEKSSDLMDETMAKQSGSRKKRKAKAAEDEANELGFGSEGVECAGISNQTSTMENSTPKKLKGRRTKDNISQVNLERYTNVNSSRKTKKESRIRGRGHGRGRGRENKAFSGDSETSHDGSSSSERDGKLQSDITETLRRSGRVRNTVNYMVSDEFNDSDKESENRLDEGGIPKKSMDQAVGVNETDCNELGESTKVELEFGVSTDDTEQVGQMNASRVNNISDQIQLSKDYLQSGGGFCVDEDEEMKIDERETGPTGEAIPAFMGEENYETDVLIRNEDALNEYDKQNPTEDDFGNGSFRAMPNLRRKRRKT